MKKEIIITGKTVEEALSNAAEELGVDSSANFEYEVVELPKKGLLGIGGTPAKIKVICKAGGEENALEFVNNLIKNMEIDAKAELSDKENGDKLINISGEGAGILIGHHGETLDSLQYLANLAANRKHFGEEKEDYVKVTVDVENYRAKREETLRTLARRMANRVLKYKKSIMLEPMNPYERRIIHSEIQNIAGVSTNSVGVENNRKIVIFLEDKKNAGKASEENTTDEE